MSILSWQKYRSAVDVSIGTDPLSPLTGTGSLLFTRPTSNWRGNVFPVAGIPYGHASGTRRFLVKLSQSSGAGQAGLCLRMSQKDISNGAGTCYAVFVDSGANLRIKLYELTAGLMTGASLAESANNAFVVGTTKALEVVWLVNGANLDFTIKSGNALDYSDLATILTFSDTTPSPAGIGEGLFARSDTANDLAVRFDEYTML